MNIRMDVISKIKNKELKYKDIPEELKEDEEIAMIAIETYDGRVCEYIGKKLKDNKDFAKKVFEKRYGYALSYFSDNVKNDFECCKTAIVNGFSGYKYIGEKMKNNKELALLEINREYGHDIREVSKELRNDKEIIEAHWNKAYRYTLYCSIIAIDDFGNNIIDVFKSEEFRRHMQSRIDKYEGRTETVQFIKCNKEKIDKEIFEPILQPLVILIGEQRNKIANEIIGKYYNSNGEFIDIIEIYKTDVNTKNIKFISKDENEIIDLLRLITYTTSGDTWLSEDNLNDIRELLLKSKMENKNLKIKLIKDIKNIDTLEKEFLNGNTFVVQAVSSDIPTLAEYNVLFEQMQEKFGKKYIQYHIHNSCNFNDFEIYILKID